MTLREMFVEIANGNITDEMKEMATAQIEKIDVANAKRREKNAEKSVKNLELAKALVAHLGTEPKTASDLVAECTDIEREDGKALNVQFMSALARKAVAAGLCEVTEIKVAKKGVQKAYFVAE